MSARQREARGGARRTWAVARLELLHDLRRPLFWIWFVVMGLMAWGFATGDARISSGDSDVGGTKAFINSEFALAQAFSALVLLIGAFFVAVAAGMTVLRDEELGVGALLHSTPLSPREYAWGKFLAVLASCLTVVLLYVVATAVLYQLGTGAEEAEYVGAFVPSNYARPFVVMALPTVILFAGVCFWLGERFRRPILVFLFPVAVVLACAFFVWSWSPSWMPDWANAVLMYTDPSGLRWLSETWLDVDRGVDFYNHQPVAYDARFLASRMVMVALGLGAAWAAAGHFARSLRGRPAGRRASTAPAATPSARRAAVPAELARLGMRASRPGFLPGLIAVTRVELRELRSSPGLYLFVPLIVLQTVANAVFQPGAFDTEVLLTSGTLAVRGFSFLSSMVCLLLLFYTVESLRREEGTRLAPIHSAAPVRTASILFGKALANSLVGVVAIGVTMLTSLVVLAVQGQVALELWPFVLIWCLILLPTFLVWCSFVAFLYSIVRGRYTTYALALGALVWTARAYWRGEIDWTFNWPLWGTLLWSDMGTFELVRAELLLNRALALLLTLLFTVLTVRLYPRRELDAAGTLRRLRPGPLARGALRLAPVLLPPLVVGLVLSARIEAGRGGDAFEKAAKDYWRKNVATWTDTPVPDVAAANVALDLRPERRAFEARGTFTLTHEHDEPIRVIALTRGFHWRRPDSLPAEEQDGEHGLWTLDGEPFEPEDAAGLMLFRLPQPLQRGEEIEIGFHHSGELPYGASRNGGGASEFVLPSGVVLTSFSPSFVPVVGYQEQIGVDEDNRYDAREFAEDHHAGDTPGLFGGNWRDFPVRLEVSAPEEFTVNGIGLKERDEVVDGRRTVVWQSDHPVRFFNVVAGKWDVARGELDTAIYHHPAHSYNIPAMLEALAAARRCYSEWFFPYPWKELKISEFPALAGYAQGFATNIPFSESIGFLTEADEDDADAPFMVTAHETAHQWWGNLLVPGRGPGANLLSEGMAHFSTLLLFEEMRGERGRIAFAKKIEDNYGENRVADSERSLVRIDGSRPGDNTVTYDKAGFVFWMLLDHMGRERCLEGLRSFVRHYRTVRDHPVLEDLVEHLRPFAPDAAAYDTFTRQWFFEVVVPEYQLDEVTRTESEGRWTVSLLVENAGTGRTPVELCAARGERFPDEPSEDDEADAPEPYREQRAQVTLGPGESAELELDCSFEPERVLVDPDAKVLMLRRRRAQHTF